MPDTTSRRSPLPVHRILAGALALALPALLLAAGLSQLLAPPDQELSQAALRMDAALAEGQPEVVVVGNSMVGRDIDAAVLSAGLADRPVSVVKTWESGTWPANWYLFLANRVFGQGYRPHAVVICMGPRVLLQTDLGSELSQRSLVDHVGEHEPLVYAKVFGQRTPNPWLQRLREHRGHFQDGWAAAVRAVSVGLLFPGTGDGLMARGEAVAAPALERVFEVDGAVDMSLHRRVIPVVEHEREVEVEVGGSALDDSFVPDLLDLADEYGARLVFVTMPMMPETQARSALEPRLEAEFVQLLNARGAALVDLSDLDLPAELFDDGVHLSFAGRKVFSPLLARALRERDLMGDGPFEANRVPFALDPQVSLVGTPPDLGPLELREDPAGEPCRFLTTAKGMGPVSDTALASAGVGVSPLVVLEDGQPLEHLNWPGKLAGACHGAFVPQSARMYVSPGAHAEPPQEQRSYQLGVATQMPVRVGPLEGWFVYPGTALRLDFAGWSGPRGDVEVLIGLEALMGEPDGASVTADGHRVSLAPQGQRWLGGGLTTPTPGGPWSIDIASSDEGPWLQVRWLAVRWGRETFDLIGSEDLMQPPAARFLLNPQQSEAIAHGQPTSFPLEIEPANPKGAFQADLSGLEDLGSGVIGERMACGRCSPLRLSVDGELAGRPELFCGRIMKGEPGLSCQRDGKFLFTTRDGSDPRTNGRHYEVALLPERQNGRRWWLYPGDRAELPLPLINKRQLRDGASRLHLEGVAMAGLDPAGEVEIRLLVGEQEVLSERVPVRSFDDGPFDRRLAQRYDLRGSGVTLELRSDPDAPYLLLEAAELAE